MSNIRSFAIGSAPLIRIAEVSGDLIVQAWPQAEVQTQTDEAGQLTVEQEGETVTLRCRDDLMVNVPYGTTLQIQAVHGDARITGTYGAVQVEQVNGDLQIRESSDTRIGQVNGDLTLRQVTGELTVDSVNGDAAITGVTGHVLISEVSDDLLLDDINGSVEASAHDDVSLRLKPAPGQSYIIKAGSDIVCRIPIDAHVTARLHAGGDIRVRKLEAPAQEATGEMNFVLGDGRAELNLTARGDIVLSGRQAEWEEGGVGVELGQQAAELAEQLGRQIEIQIEAATKQIDARLTQLDTEDIGAKVQEKVQAALRKAEETLAQAMRNVESRQGSSRGWQAPPPRPAKPAKPPKPTVSSEERLTILRMVDEGKISVEQAEQLLAALGAKKK